MLEHTRDEQALFEMAAGRQVKWFHWWAMDVLRWDAEHRRSRQWLRRASRMIQEAMPFIGLGILIDRLFLR